MKKIVCISGSPRPKGNSTTIARRVMDVAEAMGATSRTFRLYDLNFKGCVACLACKRGAEECVLKDDLAPVLAAIREADILLMASPVYFGDVTGEMKRLIDRMYSLMTPEYLTGGHPTRLAAGKQCAFILTQGYPGADAFGEAFGIYSRFFSPEWFGYETHLLRGLGLSAPTDAGENAALMAEAEELARKLMA